MFFKKLKHMRLIKNCTLYSILLSLSLNADSPVIPITLEKRPSDLEDLMQPVKRYKVEKAKPKASVLDDIVVTASRTEKNVVEVPHMIEKISRAEIRSEKMPSNMVNMFKELPSVLLQKTSHGQGSPYIRGFTGFRNVFLIDGIRLNNSVFRSGPNQYWNTIDPYTIENFEILKGPASVLYGSDAAGGAVQALTRSLSKKEIEHGFLTRFSTAEDSIIGRYDLSYRFSPKLGFVGGLTLKRFGQLRTGEGMARLPHTDYDEAAKDLKFIYEIDDRNTLTFAHQSFSQDDVWRTHKTVHARSFNGTTVGNEKRRSLNQDRNLSYLKLESAGIEFFDSFIGTLSLHNQEEDRFRIKKDDSQDLQGFEVSTLGLTLQANKMVLNHSLSFGLDYYKDDVDSFKRKFNTDGTFKSESIQGPVGDDAEYTTKDIFINDDILVSDQVEVMFGVRYTKTEASAGKVQDPATGNQIAISNSWDDIVASARLMVFPLNDSKVSVFAGISQAFRAPNLSDLTRLDSARSNEIETPSPKLDPESFLTYEIGSKFSIDQWSGSIAYYYTMVEDLITRTPTGVVIAGDDEVTKKNSGDGYVQGLELNSAYQIKPFLTFKSSMAWMDSKVDTFPTSAPVLQKEVMDRMLPTTFNFSLKYKKEKIWLEAFTTIAKKQNKLSTRDSKDTQRIPPGGTPGYTVFNIRGGYALSKNVSLSLAIENLTDKSYRIHGSGQNEAGINSIFSIQTKF